VSKTAVRTAQSGVYGSKKMAGKAEMEGDLKAKTFIRRGSRDGSGEAQISQDKGAGSAGSLVLTTMPSSR